MKVQVKDFYVDMDIKNRGVELAVRSTKNRFIGDLIVTKTGLEWCKGKTTRGHGVKVTWNDFIARMKSKTIRRPRLRRVRIRRHRL